MKVYLIRSQVSGVLTDRVFLRPPTEAELNEVLGRDLASHGHKNGVPAERFVSYIEVETVGSPSEGDDGVKRVAGKLTPAESEYILTHPNEILGDSGVVDSDAGQISFEGVGEVINPDDPRHPKYVKLNAPRR